MNSVGNGEGNATRRGALHTLDLYQQKSSKATSVAATAATPSKYVRVWRAHGLHFFSVCTNLVEHYTLFVLIGPSILYISDAAETRTLVNKSFIFIRCTLHVCMPLF